ncbi:MAG: GNAT family N-acetyltransferase [Alistipes sp.]|nr:GNAT family N-acetyltransferase [Alistipes senegalensis]MCM1250866.1 GNAT family N-acetyltransferase [Alistipes sp.]
MEIRKTDTPPWDLLLLGDESPESVADYIDRGDCYVAVEEGRTVGVCMLLRTHPFTVEIVNLAVDPAFQGRGIGSDLIHDALRRAREEGRRRIEIATADAENGPLHLYRSFGFEPVEIERDYFPKYYPAPIVEAGEECRDLVRLRMEL